MTAPAVPMLTFRAAARADDDATTPPRRVRLGMPHLDVGGLAEGWLFREVGDLCWEAIGRQLGVATSDIRADDRARIYPTVVALRARYDAPLSDVRENDVFDARIEVTPCGRACAHGRVAAATIGRVDHGRQLTLAAGDARALLWDLGAQPLTGFGGRASS